VGTQKIDPNGTYQVTLVKDNPPAGTYNWQFTVDPANQVIESDETNNVRTVEFIVNP
jgi:subtilase family serine protease